jgi:hypothetical protein
MSDERPDRSPLTDRELQRVALEIAIACVAWVGATVGLADAYLDLADRATAATALGGGIAIALSIGWWRIIRHGPAAPPRPRAGVARRSDPPDTLSASSFLFSACCALVMSVLLLAPADHDGQGLVWGGVFAVLAVVQYVRYLRHRDRSGR